MKEMGFSYVLKYEYGGKSKKTIRWEKDTREISTKGKIFLHLLIHCRKLYVYSFFSESKNWINMLYFLILSKVLYMKNAKIFWRVLLKYELIKIVLLLDISAQSYIHLFPCSLICFTSHFHSLSPCFHLITQYFYVPITSMALCWECKNE